MLYDKGFPINVAVMLLCTQQAFAGKHNLAQDHIVKHLIMGTTHSFPYLQDQAPMLMPDASIFWYKGLDVL